MRLADSPASSSSSPSPDQHPAGLPIAPPKPGRRRMDKDLHPFKSAYPLQRGSACLSCRKRKMKCDAGKPACGQCLKANRATDCDYDDGKSKSRTQLLQEKIATLEARLRELEGGPSNATRAAGPALQRPSSAPGPHFYDGSSDNMFVPGFDLTTLATTRSASPGSPSGSTWMGDQYDLKLPNDTALSRVPSPESLAWGVNNLALAPADLLHTAGRWWELEHPPPRIQQLLLDIFLPHRQQCGFEVDLGRFHTSLTSGDPPHPALLNAIFALACHFSLSPLLVPHEPRFVARALRAISRALEASDRLVHVLQASCLLAVLFFAKGRLLEGYYHAGAATRLAVGLGLHQIATPEWGGSPEASPASSRTSPSEGGDCGSILPPPADSLELGERILAFWQVFNLDRCWAVATGLPVALSDDNHPRTRVETVWPRALEEYELGHVADADYGTVHVLYAQVTTLPYAGARDSTNALRAKATTLFERAARLSSSFGTSAQTAEQFWADFQTVDAAIARLAAGVPGAREADAPRADHALFVVHALLHAATIQLHSPFALEDAASRQKSAAVAAQAVGMIHLLDEPEYAFLDPIMGTCWTSIAEAVVRELIMRRAAGTNVEHHVAVLNQQLDLIVLAMNRLGATVPLAAYQASKVEQSRVMSF